MRFSATSGQKLAQYTLNIFLSLPRHCCLAVAVCKSTIGQKGGALFPVSCFHGNWRNIPGVKGVAELPIAILVVLSAVYQGCGFCNPAWCIFLLYINKL